MTQIVEEIKQILFSHDLTYKWLAEHIHLDKDKLYYLLNHAKSLPVETYIDIMSVFEDEELLPMGGGRKNLSQRGLQLGCVTGEELAKVNRAIMRIENGEKITPEEKLKITDLVTNFREKIDHECDHILELIH